MRLFYDPADGGPPVLPGDWLITRTGKTYAVLSATPQRRGGRAGRVRLVCLVQREPGPEGRRHPLVWYSRGRK